MQKAQVYIDSAGKVATSTTGVLLTADKVAEMAKGNLLEAFSLMSKLQNEGVISTGTMQKMFTGRHFTEAQAVLRAVGGDWERFNRVFAQGVDYQQDYAKQMMNVNNEIAKLRNNVLSLGLSGGSSNYLNTLITGTTLGLNDIIEKGGSTSKSLFDLGTHVVGLGAQFGVLYKGLSMIKTGMLSLTPVMGVVSGIVTLGAFAWQKYNLYIKEAEINLQSFLDVLSGEQIASDKLAVFSQQSASGMAELNRVINEIRDGKFVLNGLDDTSYAIAGILGITDKWGDSLLTVKEAFSEINRGATALEQRARRKQEYDLREKAYKSNEAYDTQKEVVKSKFIDEAVSRRGEFYRKEIEAQAKIWFDEIEKGEMKTFDKMSDYIEKSSRGMFGFSSDKGLNVKLLSSSMEGEITKLAEISDERKKSTDDLKKFSEDVEKEIKGKQDILEKLQGTLNNVNIENAKKQMNILKEHGKINVGGVELSGESAFKKINIDSFGGNKEAQERFDSLYGRFLEMEGKKIDFSSPESIEYAMNAIMLLGNISALEEEITLLKIEQEKIGVGVNGNLDTEIKYREDFRNKLLENLRLNRVQKSYDDDKLRLAKNTNEYTFKYKNYLKESLDIELERLKIGKTAGQQAVLEYEYKVKQLEVNKELADQELKSAKLMGQKSLGGLTDLSATRANLETLQAQRDALTSQTFQVGEAGKANKDKLVQLDAIMTAMVKVLDLEERIALAPLQEFNKLSDNFPKTLKTIIDSLADSRLPSMNIWKDMLELQDIDLQESMDKISKSFNKEITSGNIDTSIQDQVRNVLASKKKVQEAEKKGGKALSDATLEYVEQVELLNDMNDLKKDILDKDKTMLEYYQQMNKPFEQTGSLFSTLGSVFGNDNLTSIGNIFTDFADVNSQFKSGDFGLDFGSMFKDGKFDAQAMGKVMESASAVMALGQMGGSLMASVFGGNSQMGGELGSIGGMIGTMVGGPVGGLIGSALGGLAGGMFGGDSGKDQEKAQQKTNEANRLYQENTNALNKLANNMANLNSGIDSLNSSLLSSFSQIPTFDKLNNVTDALKEMNKTLISSRDFGSVAFQVTKSKKSGGGLFSKGQTVQWTETHEKTLQDMLNQYGFKGSIYDMDSKQLQNFADWLEDVKLGEQSNVEGMSQLIHDYADAMNKLEDNINDFFYDATMEGFSGISSIAQEELKQQLTEYYKNLGITIDEEMQKEIDKLAEQMSIMVTVMTDVRGEFLDVWRETGTTSGEAFISSMKPYMDSLLGNISQIYYDVYFSDVTKALEDSFKKMSEELVELKKEGANLNWDDVGSKLAGEFDKVLNAIISAKQESESFNEIIMQLQKQAIEAGLSLGELFETGLVTGTQGEVLEMFKDAVLSKDDDGALKAVGDFMGDKIGKALSEKLMDNLFSSQILEFGNELDKVLSGELKFSQLAGLMSQANAIGINIESQRLQMEAILAGFEFGDITYSTDSSKVEYSAGSSQQNTYVYNISSAINTSNVIESDSIQSLADELLDIIIEKLKVDKGVDITKNY
ncbi:MAG: hypothetical protein ACRDDY_03905 [Clostridium sp.]|uniref:hypothetical protein n=1 Tax=Clostridium sp. TaxID=1506 RepID=UPI003EE534E6